LRWSSAALVRCQRVHRPVVTANEKPQVVARGGVADIDAIELPAAVRIAGGPVCGNHEVDEVVLVPLAVDPVAGDRRRRRDPLVLTGVSAVLASPAAAQDLPFDVLRALAEHDARRGERWR